MGLPILHVHGIHGTGTVSSTLSPSWFGRAMMNKKSLKKTQREKNNMNQETTPIQEQQESCPMEDQKTATGWSRISERWIANGFFTERAQTSRPD